MAEESKASTQASRRMFSFTGYPSLPRWRNQATHCAPRRTSTRRDWRRVCAAVAHTVRCLSKIDIDDGRVGPLSVD